MRAIYKEYENGYTMSGAETLENMRRQQTGQKRNKTNHRRFLKQRVLGVAIQIFTVLTVWALEGDATIAIITVPLGLVLIFSRKNLVVNGYYSETEGEK